MAQSDGITTKDPKAKETVDAALKAIGGEDKTSSIKSIIIKGSETRIMWMSSQSTIDGKLTHTTTPSTNEFEIRILLPDNFIQITRLPTRTTYTGISQGALLTLPPAAIVTDSSGVGNTIQTFKAAEGTAKSRADAGKDEWACFLAGMLIKAGPMPLTLSSGSTPGVFNLTNHAGDFGEIEFDSKTGYPSVVRYKTTRGSMSTIIGGPGDSLGRDSNITQDMVENEIGFHDRFSIEGIMFPKTISMTGPPVDRTLYINSVQINPKLSLKDFEVPKQ